MNGTSKYRFGEFFVLSREGGSVRSSGRRRGPILDRREYVRSRQTYQYAVKGRDSLRVSVSVRRTWRFEVKRPFTIGARFESPEDTVEVVDSTAATILFGNDTAAAWQVTMVERTGTAVPDGHAFVGTVTNGARTIQLVPVRSAKSPRPRGLRGLFYGYANGFVFEEDGRDIAALQFWGTGRNQSIDQRVWMPIGLTARARIEFAAIFTAVLANASFLQVSP